MNFEDLKVQAETGDGFACFMLGKAYMDGKMSLEVDYDKGFYWYNKGAKTINNGLCLYCLGNVLENGKCGFKDLKRAEELFAEGYGKLVIEAEKGETNALYYLGNYFFFGKANVKVNYNMAFELYLKSAKQGKAAAQNNVGFMYFNGLGVIQNYEKSLYWYKLAAKSGLSSSIEMVKVIENLE